MCGIVAYIGKRDAYPILINGLKRLEYRGYDSAGVALLNEKDELNVYKTKGKVSDLENFAKDKDISGHIGIAHTRWATHGEPNDVNAHPHLSRSGNIALIHNGIIENYLTIRKELENRGYEFKSSTDTEVLVNLIEDVQLTQNVDLFEATRIALNHVNGAYAIALIEKGHPDTLVAARKGSPMVVGIGKNEFFIASDATPIVGLTSKVVYIENEEVMKVKLGEDLRLKTIDDVEITPYVQKLKLNLESIEKGGFDHFMLKEIYEQPTTVRDTMRGRLHANLGTVTLGGIFDYEKKILNARNIIIVACGTSWHAGLVGSYLIELYSGIRVKVEYASEFRYRNPVIFPDDVVIAISQSGETADTLAAIEIAKEKGATVLGICNVIGSSISRVTDAGVYTHAGPEIGVASTKAFTAQVAVLTMFAIRLAELTGYIPKSRIVELIHELDMIPDKIKTTLERSKDIVKEIAEQMKDCHNALYLGRLQNFPVALEGALKLKEISYIHAEGYPAAEMKHGPIALIDKDMPVIFIATNKSTYEKVVSNVQEVKARQGKIISVVTEGDVLVKNMSDYVIEIPDTECTYAPLLATIPLQLLAYYIAVYRGCNVDQPRNLAKSVTVE
ncbi:MAG: glutamine--fructose-6-phosphate transaminase (isomerizing) [Bacteroidales bacterium]|nr:glutamine--fructose-6-phosphate transaminase (isomerizing) [Bacteroidales bacterium]